MNPQRLPPWPRLSVDIHAHRSAHRKAFASSLVDHRLPDVVPIAGDPNGAKTMRNIGTHSARACSSGQTRETCSSDSPSTTRRSLAASRASFARSKRCSVLLTREKICSSRVRCVVGNLFRAASDCKCRCSATHTNYAVAPFADRGEVVSRVMERTHRAVALFLRGYCATAFFRRNWLGNAAHPELTHCQMQCSQYATQ